MQTTKNDKKKILPPKKAKFSSFFVGFVRVCKSYIAIIEGSAYGSVSVLLLGISLRIAYLPSFALADFGSNDAENLDLIRRAMWGGSYNGLQYNGVADDTALLRQNLIYFANGTDLQSPLGYSSNYITGDRDSLQNGGPRNRLSMLQVLNAIGQGLGTVTTNGYWVQNTLSLPQLILGWNTDSFNPAVRTNGVIGRIDALRESMEQIADETKDYQNSVTGLLQNIAVQLSSVNKNQTNQMYISSALYTGQDGWTDLSDVDQFIEFINSYGISWGSQFAAGNTGYNMPLYYIPVDEDIMNGEEYTFSLGMYNRPSYQDLVAKRYAQIYGTYASYDSAFGSGNDYGTYEFEGSSNILSQTTPIRPVVSNTIPSTLSPIQGIPEIAQDVADFQSIRSDYQHLTGPSQQEITKFAGYLENSFVESQDKAGFSFGITFSGVAQGQEDVSIQTDDVDFFESIDLQRISSIGNTWIRYGVSIVKGILMILFIWAVAEKAVGIFINNGMQAG